MNSMTGIVREDTAAPNRPTHIFMTPVAWGAIISGAIAAASLSLILVVLGSLLGYHPFHRGVRKVSLPLA